jgi:hypothetical protein
MRPTSFTHVMGPSGPVSFGTEAKGPAVLAILSPGTTSRCAGTRNQANRLRVKSPPQFGELLVAADEESLGLGIRRVEMISQCREFLGLSTQRAQLAPICSGCVARPTSHIAAGARLT